MSNPGLVDLNSCCTAFTGTPSASAIGARLASFTPDRNSQSGLAFRMRASPSSQLMVSKPVPEAPSESTCSVVDALPSSVSWRPASVLSASVERAPSRVARPTRTSLSTGEFLSTSGTNGSTAMVALAMISASMMREPSSRNADLLSAAASAEKYSSANSATIAYSISVVADSAVGVI